MIKFISLDKLSWAYIEFRRFVFKRNQYDIFTQNITEIRLTL